MHVGVVQDPPDSDEGMADKLKVSTMYIFPDFVQKLARKRKVECITFENEPVPTKDSNGNKILKWKYCDGEVFRLSHDHDEHGDVILDKKHLTAEEMRHFVDFRIDVLRDSSSIGDLVGYSEKYSWFKVPLWIISLALAVAAICSLIAICS